MKLIFATNNVHKLQEARAILGDTVEVLSLSDIDCHEDIPETADTLEGNSAQKAEYVYNKYGVNCFADDTGLEVEALDGAPGVYTARYASVNGEHPTPAQNRAKMLRELQGVDNRKARFRTVVTLIKDGKIEQVDGVINGRITTEEIGEHGFGYDPIFVPEGYDLTFAQMAEEEKNSISHRALAMQALAQLLSE